MQFRILKFYSIICSNTSLLNIFMAIIYCKPDLIALHQLTDYLGGASKVYCNELCRGKQSGISNYTHLSIRRYSSESCPLQVYAVLLEVAFQPNLQSKTHTELTACISLLTKITVGLMRFMRNCFKCSATWLFQLNDAATEMSSSTSCYCHCYMVRATIVLLHLCVKHWIRDRKCIGMEDRSAHFAQIALISVSFQMPKSWATYSKWPYYFCTTISRSITNDECCLVADCQSRIDCSLSTIPSSSITICFHSEIHTVSYALFLFISASLSNSIHWNIFAVQALKSLDLQLKILMHEPQRPSPEQQLQQQQSNRTMNGMANGSQVLANIFDRFTLKWHLIGWIRLNKFWSEHLCHRMIWWNYASFAWNETWFA